LSPLGLLQDGEAGEVQSRDGGSKKSQWRVGVPESWRCWQKPELPRSGSLSRYPFVLFTWTSRTVSIHIFFHGTIHVFWIGPLSSLGSA
jgi:hypothetical protein